MTLEVQEVDSFYGDLQVLRKVSLTVGEGEVVALLGPNGHGKSTLLKAIAGLHPASLGSIRYRGTEISKITTERIVQMGLAYIPEERHLFPHMTVLENLFLGAYNPNARSRIKENLEFVFTLFPRLNQRKDQTCSTLSGGESRMVAIGRGLMSGASLLLVDEPSIGLSPALKKAVFDSIERINQGKGITILIVEQEIEHALRLATRVYMMKKGAILFERESGALDKAEIERAYF
jgi:branched-chain amino acid transport system ATP-binding protein